MVLNTGFPTKFCCPSVGKLEDHRWFVLLKFTRTHLNVEILALVGDFQYFRPSKSINPQSARKGKNNKF